MKNLLSKTLNSVLVVSSMAYMACSPNNFSQEKVKSSNSDISLFPEFLDSSSDIIGGSKVKPTDSIISSIVGIYDISAGAICTGSIIDNNIVLTAAHCINSDPSQMVILFGTNLDATKVFRRVDFAGAHKLYAPQDNEESEWNDIGLIHFVGQLPKGFKPAKFLPNQYKIKAGDLTLLAGYGLSDGVNKTGASVLRKTSVAIANPEFFQGQVVLDQRAGRGACHGDSGGPAYIQTKDGLMLWGVTSRGYHDKLDHCSQFAVYTNSIKYNKWINDSKLYFQYQFGQDEFTTNNTTVTPAQLNEMKIALFMN